MTRGRAAALFSALFIGALVLANVLTDRYGFVSVGFGLSATAGTYAAGLMLALRDVVQDTGGRRLVLGVIVLAAVISYAIGAPEIALASAIAVLVAELADFAVYTPLRRRSQLGDGRWAVAVIASNVVGAVVDTVIFISLAFGFAAVSGAFAGQLVGKLLVTVAFLVVAKAVAQAVKEPAWSR